MKRQAIILLLLLFGGNVVFSQNDSYVLFDSCWKDTTLIKIERIEEYSYPDRNNKLRNTHIVVYLIKSRFSNPEHKNYGESLIIASIDTIMLQKESNRLIHIEKETQNNIIKEGGTYMFHLELYGCFPIVGHIHSKEFNVDGIRIPIRICPLQPYKAIELRGLYYKPYIPGIH